MKKLNCKDCNYFDLDTIFTSTEVHLCTKYNIARYNDETCPEIGCDYCDPNSDDYNIYKNSDGRYYMKIRTGSWDQYLDIVYIKYCPICGRRL